MVQSAEGSLHEVHDMLKRMNKLAIKEANGTNAMEGREYLQKEIDQIILEVDKVASITTFDKNLPELLQM